jgi:hypothetical protein
MKGRWIKGNTVKETTGKEKGRSGYLSFTLRIYALSFSYPE